MKKLMVPLGLVFLVVPFVCADMSEKMSGQLEHAQAKEPAQVYKKRKKRRSARPQKTTQKKMGVEKSCEYDPEGFSPDVAEFCVDD